MPTQPAEPEGRALPRMGGVMTVFYYADSAPAVAFYERVLGFEKVLDLGWVAIVRVSGQSFLTLVDGSSGSQQPIPGANKGAILSIETDALEEWRARLAAAGACATDAPFEPGCGGRSAEFQVRDPGGYTVEFFRWLDPPPAWKI